MVRVESRGRQPRSSKAGWMNEALGSDAQEQCSLQLEAWNPCSKTGPRECLARLLCGVGGVLASALRQAGLPGSGPGRAERAGRELQRACSGKAIDPDGVPGTGGTGAMAHC